MRSIREKILVPTDGSMTSEKILDIVRPLVVKGETEIRLLRVVPESGIDETLKGHDVFAEARHELEALVKTVSRWGARSVAKAVMVGDPAAKILEYAESQKPTLVAMSTHGRTGVKRWIRGSVAERVLRECPYPLLLANPFGLEKSARFERILVPVDGSPASASILTVAGELADVHRSEVILLHVPTRSAIDGTPKVTHQDLEDLAKEHESDLAGAKVRIHTTGGPAAEAILKTVSREACDLVAMTTHGRSGVSRWVLGSTAEQVLRQCRSPLLILRTGRGTKRAPRAARSGKKPLTII